MDNYIKIYFINYIIYCVLIELSQKLCLMYFRCFEIESRNN